MIDGKRIARAADGSLKIAGLVLLAMATWMVVTLAVDIARFWMSATIWPVVEARLLVYALAWLGGLRLARGRQGGVKLVCVAAVYSICGYAVLQPELPTALFSLPGELSGTAAACVDAGIMGLLLVAAFVARRGNEPSERRRTWQFQIRDVAAGILLFGLLLGCRVTQQRHEAVADFISESSVRASILQNGAPAAEIVDESTWPEPKVLAVPPASNSPVSKPKASDGLDESIQMRVLEPQGNGVSGLLSPSIESPGLDMPSCYAASDLLATHYPHTLVGRTALWSTGHWLLEQKRYTEAIDRFEQLLTVPLPSAAHWDDSYRWYFATDAYHRASVDLSMCYESLGDDEAALHFARLAQNKYLSCQPCGVAAAGSWIAAEERVKLLEQKVAHR